MVGPPGSGKTRLALEAGSRSVGGFGDGVWFVSLSAVSDPTQVASAVATTFGIRPGATDRMTALLVDHLDAAGRAGEIIDDSTESVKTNAKRVANVVGFDAAVYF